MRQVKLMRVVGDIVSVRKDGCARCLNTARVGTLLPWKSVSRC